MLFPYLFIWLVSVPKLLFPASFFMFIFVTQKIKTHIQ